VVFSGDVLVARGEMKHAAASARRVLDANPLAPLLCYDEWTSEAVELDLRGSVDEVVARYAVDVSIENTAFVEPEPSDEHPATPRGPGRPKLGVVSREVTLLPRHWAWLATQPGGASVALRRLVEDARRNSAASDARRLSREATYRFMVATAGDRAGFEEATRALYAGDAARFAELLHAWPRDVREHALRLAAPALLAVSE
jgi:hypothetical protein